MSRRRVDADRLWGDVMALAEITEPDRPWTRRSFTARYDEGRRWLRGRMEAAGLAVEMDAAGNMIGRREGRLQGAPAIAVGSHTDTVPGGGRFDGVAGVCAGLEIARTLAEAGDRLDCPLEVIDFLAEEPSEFGLSCVGSRGLAGALTTDMLGYRHPDGRLLGDAVAAAGGDPGRLSGALRDDMAAYFELHIEQARALETAGVSVGIVTSIAAVTRVAIVFEGSADHAGATPLDLRADALLAAARTVIAVRSEAERIAAVSEAYFVATVGTIDVRPNAANVVPATARLSVDIRSGRPGDADLFLEAVEAAAKRAAREYRVACAGFEIISRSEPADADAGLREVLGAAARDLGLRTKALASGAGHDALFVSRIAPMAMVFVPCRAGKSHCPEEWADKADLRDGADTMLAAIRRLDAALSFKRSEGSGEGTDGDPGPGMRQRDHCQIAF